VLAQLGHLDEAADVLDRAAEHTNGPAAQAFRAAAKKLRSRRN